MSSTTGIEWCDATWNPVTGCTKVSQGCKHCYAERLFPRVYSRDRIDLSKPSGAVTSPRRFTDVWVHPERLEQPLRWRKPKRIFVNSMSDLFHEQVPDEFIDQVFAVMGLARWHTFQVLTKRPERMQSYLCGHAAGGRHIWTAGQQITMPAGRHKPETGWPLPNVWLGVSVENQETADERIPLLLETPAAVRFLSVEPLLGPVDLVPYLFIPDPHGAPADLMPACALHWVIVGGESGPGARPMPPAWVRSIRDQCVMSGVKFFFKQWGEWVPWIGRKLDDLLLDQPGRHALVMPDGTVHTDFLPGGEVMARVGKKAAGRLLDGRTWEEMPSQATRKGE